MGWSVLGAGIDALAGRRDNMFNKKEADRARDWSKEMANTEMQRRVADLMKAGLNPMLAITEGAASTPSSAQASAGSKGTNFAAAFSAQQMIRMAKDKNAAEIAQIEANTAKTVEETKQLSETTPYSSKNAFFTNEILFSQMKKMASEVSTANSEAEVRALMPEAQRLINRGMALGMSEKEATSEFFKQVGEGSKWTELLRNLLIGVRQVR